MLRSILPIAQNTFTDLVRQKVFHILLVFALCAIGLSFYLSQVGFQDEFQMLKDVCLGAMSVFTSLLAIVATSGFLPRDLEERTIYTLLAKPVPRTSYLAGKLLGMIFLLFLFLVIMSAAFLGVMWLREQAKMAGIRAEFAEAPREELQAALDAVTRSTFNANLAPGILIIFVKSALLASMTLLVSTFATSYLFTVMISAAMYFIGHLQAIAREAMLGGIDVHWWTRLLVGLVALVFPDLQAFNLTDDVIAGAAIPWGVFLGAFGLGWVYVAIYFLAAAFVFAGREL